MEQDRDTLRRRITELEDELAELREDERLYRTVVESARDFIFMVGSDGRVLYVNPSGRRVLGLDPAEVVGRPLSELFRGGDADRQRRNLGRVFETGEPLCTENHTTFQGAQFWLDTWLLPVRDDASDEISAVIGVSRDVTDRKQQEQRLRMLVDNAPVILFVADPERRIVHLEGKALQSFPIDAEQAIGQNAYEIFPELAHWEELFPRVMDGQTVTASTELFGKTFQARIAALRGQDGELSGFIGVATDVTEHTSARRALEEEMRRVEKLESVGLLAGGLAHDFNNLLTSVLGNVSIVRRWAGENDRLQARLEDAEQAVERARDLTKQLLTFSRGGEPVKTLVEVGPLVEQATEFALAGSRSGCAIDLADDLNNVEADAGQIGQVIQNLVINADQACPGGTVFVSALNIEVAAGERLPLSEGDYVCVSVRDEGPGIPERHLDRIFDPYFTTKDQGTGLGLTTSYSIVRQHGGHITVDALGKGAAFHVYLPATTRRPSRRLESVKPGPPDAQGAVLVMDDEPEVRRVVRDLLHEMGYDVEVAADGAEAISVYRRRLEQGRPFDAVLMDLTVRGGMGGEEAVGRLRAIDPEARVIVSSGYSNNPVISRYTEYGFDGMVPKPYGMAELAVALERVLG